MKKPKCKECKKSDEVVRVGYDLGDIKDYYWECERCYCVVSRISKFPLDREYGTPEVENERVD
jgi:hypothetical protein